MDHWGYLAVAIATHAAVGYALVRSLTTCPPSVGALAGVAPDVDLLFGPMLLDLQYPLVHRGLTHTPAFLGLVLLVVLLVDRRRGDAAGPVALSTPRGVTRGLPAAGGLSLGVGVAYLSHLAIDSLTRSGIMWLYPLSENAFALALGVHGVAGTVVLWSASVGILAWGGGGRHQWLARD